MLQIKADQAYWYRFFIECFLEIIKVDYRM